MSMQRLTKVLALIVIAVMTFSLSACSTHILNEDFLNLNINGSPTNAPTTSDTEDTTPTDPNQPNPTEPSESTPTEPVKKPGGFELKDEPTTEHTQPAPSNPNTPDAENPEKNEADKPVQPQQPSGSTSASLRAALNSFGKTLSNGTVVVAYNPQVNADGSISIVYMTSNKESSKRYDYCFYESVDAYNEAKTNFADNACDDTLRLILCTTSDTYPVTNPETLTFVLFGGYRLWR